MGAISFLSSQINKLTISRIREQSNKKNVYVKNITNQIHIIIIILFTVWQPGKQNNNNNMNVIINKVLIMKIFFISLQNVQLGTVTHLALVSIIL